MSTSDIKNVTKVLRSLCISHKDPIQIFEICKNFEDTEGVKLNVSQFGFDTVEKFLRSRNEFRFYNMNGEVHVTALLNDDSKHIGSMVSKQKDPNRSSLRARARPPHRHPQKSDNSWNKSTYSTNVYQQLRRPHNTTQRSFNSRIKASGSDTNNNYSSRNGYQSPKPFQRKNNNFVAGAQNKKSNGSFDNRRRSTDTSELNLSSPAPRAILGQNSSPNPQRTKNPTKQTQKENFNFSSSRKSSNTMLPSELHHRNMASKTKEPAHPKQSVQDRFKMAVSQCPPLRKPPAKVDNENNEDKSNTTREIDDKLRYSQAENYDFNPNIDPIKDLEQYCVVRRYLLPEYTTLCSKFCNMFHGRVLINGSIYTTYPEEYKDDLSCRMACAKKAIQQIQSTQRNRYTVCTDSDYDLMLKICEELENHPSGIFTKSFSECFENSYKQALPEDWWIRVKNFDTFTTESFGDNSILFLKPPSPTGSIVKALSKSPSLPSIELPWKSKYWNLYITNCVSTISIWARLLDENNELFEKLLSEIEKRMKSHKSRPVSIEIGQIYLVFIVDSWHRVRVDKIETIKDRCLCFFIDFGDSDSIQNDQLYSCDMDFLNLPAQAIPFSLFGLEDFAENPVTKKHLENILLEKSLVGEILTNQSTYESTETSPNSLVHIQLVLYDTSSNEDINLNPLLLKKFCDDTKMPEIKSTITNVIITFVNNEGDIYLQVAKRELDYVKKLIQQLVESKFKRDQHVVPVDAIQASTLYLIQDIEDNRWYRGQLACDNISKTKRTVPMYYVDVGVTKNIDVNNVFQLESLSAALSKFPFQALKVKLGNLPTMNEHIVARIQALLPAELSALAKMVKTDVIPHVVIYRRFEALKSLYNVNEMIGVEQEIAEAEEQI